ncbi:hypothetical protein [Chitinophaga terrae (ex Kim and Jung 2007)]|jgi:hypothetical protein|uniref:hypothetical protein n=1 Tax=Chitinophaga terrae (ex Kim and Jung 2007) TaxID=408074 RepID=UPI002626B9A8|nr:hypothetical protein [Chitinophaga terrae (ex Kim and Jung 2007)]MDQ0109107.1 hypothetical protein [Chitinophaga terrae (ex Kim and Jung 2007)]
MKPTIYVRPDMALPDNDQWQHRFNVKSESSNRLYVISQNKKGRHWACSCPGWKAHRTCKHLSVLGLPGKCTPYEVNLINE